MLKWKKANSKSEVSFIVPLMSNKSQLVFAAMEKWKLLHKVERDTATEFNDA